MCGNYGEASSIKKMFKNEQEMLSVRSFKMRLDEYYFSCDFSDYYPHLYSGKLKHNISTAVSCGLPQVTLVYQGREMIQPRKSFLKFDPSSNKAFKNYDDLNQIMMSFFFHTYQSKKHHRMNLKHKIQWHQLFLTFF